MPLMASITCNWNPLGCTTVPVLLAQNRLVSSISQKNVLVNYSWLTV